jgi:hypothetical protein
MFSHGGGGEWIDSAYPYRYPIIISPVFTNIMLIIPNIVRLFVRYEKWFRFATFRAKTTLENDRQKASKPKCELHLRYSSPYPDRLASGQTYNTILMVMNSLSQIVEGLNRLLPKEIRSRR